MSLKTKKDDVIRAEIASSLDLLAEVLRKSNVVPDIFPLRNAADECRKYHYQGMWGYTVQGLVFRRVGKLKAFQRGFDLNNVTIKFSMRIEGKCYPLNGEDPLVSLGLNIFIIGDYEGENDVKTASSSWHLDKHGFNEETEFMHPIYHLSFGGIEFEEGLDAKNEAILLIDSPRIPHPPMDAILGIDFVITNFLGNSLSAVRDDGYYANILSDMQKKLWKPYFDSLHGFWQENAHALIWQPSLIIPQLRNN
jgi:hypothetical protein